MIHRNLCGFCCGRQPQNAIPDYKPPLILKDFLNEWVAEGEAYNPRDFTIYQKSPAGFDTK